MNRFVLLVLFLASIATPANSGAANPRTVLSPGRKVQLAFRLDESGKPLFQIRYRNELVASGSLGLVFFGTGPLDKNLIVVEEQRNSRDETYSIAVGKASSARDHYRELIVTLQEQKTPHRKLEIALRAYDEGAAFRYRIPRQEPLTSFILTDELTQFRFEGDPEARVQLLDNFKTSYETWFETKPLSEIGTEKLVGLPLLLERAVQHEAKTWIAVTEANLTDYAGMYLAGEKEHPHTLTTRLSPLPDRKDGAKVLGETPHVSPWRVLMLADDPGRLIESNLVFHLNDPPAIEDTSWIEPGKTTFPWWNHYTLEGVAFRPGVNTATMKHYIDFCAEQGIPYHSLDGLDIAWYGGPIAPRGQTDVTTPAPSIDIRELLDYAKQKGVRLRLWMHWKALRPQIDEAFATYERWGIEGVMVDFMNRDDQEMVNFYHEMAEKAAKHHLTLTLHGAYKPTGMERTWPNVLSYEAILNQEYNKWKTTGGNGASPRHNLDAAFIRMLAGPLDYHQGGMRNVLPKDYRFSNVAPPVLGTRGHQLAMYVIYQNHMSMLVDYPSAYRDQPGFDFLVDVPTTWDETRVLHAEIGKCLVIARRKGNRWYLGGMTAEESRTLFLPLGFLGAGRFQTRLYLDDPSRGATALTRHQQALTASDTLKITMPASGGFVGRLSQQSR